MRSASRRSCAAALLLGRRGGELVRAAADAGRGRGDRGDGARSRPTPPASAERGRRRPSRAEPRDWDGATYDRVADPMTRWGADVLDRLPLRGDETVLDAGCGSGRVTEQLLERLPRGRVVALDASPSMVEAARERLAPFGDRVSFVGRGPRAAAAARAGVRRRDPLDRDLPLGRRPRRAVREPRRGPAAGRPARRAVRRRRQHRGASGAAIARDRRGWTGPWTFATPDETRAPARGRGLHATSRPGSTTSRRRSSPASRSASTCGRSSSARTSSACRRDASATRSSPRSPTRLPDGDDRLRPAQHPRDPRGLRPASSAPTRNAPAVARDHDVGGGEDPLAVVPRSRPGRRRAGRPRGVRSSRHHRWVIA